MNHVTAAQALSERGVELAVEDESYGDHLLSDAQLLEHACLELADARNVALDEVLAHFDELQPSYAELVAQLERVGDRNEVSARRERREVARVLRAVTEVGGAA